ncbi:MAG: hypothetical protein LBT25_01095 [Candidatus Symbiothrix sp.]|jgi:hypothetical protein|nr:hypothetical protein [Candidatus Symbiothrix sp.]
MKNLLIIFGFFTVSFATMAQEKKVAWDYPVKPGTEEWKKFESNEAMVNACQIPEKVLSSISTNDLVEICLQYPLLYDIFAFNNLNEGLDKLHNDFNGIMEFYKRKEAVNELLKHYNLKIQNLDFLAGKASEVEKGLYIISISAIEVLLCQYDVQNEMSKEILRNLVSGYESKSIYADYFKGLGFRTNLYSRVHVITKMNKQSLEKLESKAINAVLASGMADIETGSMLDGLSYQLIK